MAGSIEAQGRRLSRLLVGLICCAGALSAATATAPDPLDLLNRLRSTELAPESSVYLEDISIPVGEAELQVSAGTLIPTDPVAGRVVEWVFVGQARFKLEPPDAIEADQLDMFAGEPRLDVLVDSLVMVRADDDFVLGLLDHQVPTTPSAGILARAQEVHRGWLEGAERQATGIRGGLYSALIGDSAFDDYFAVWCQSAELGSFVFEYDPEDPEPYTLASFTPIEMLTWDRLRLARHLRHQQRKGRWLGTRIQDLGSWDIWLSGPWDPAAESTATSGFEPSHYDLDIKIERDESTIQGRATIQLKAMTAGKRVVPLELFRDLKVQRVRDGEGRELFSFRSGGDVLVVLDQPTEQGELLELEIRYSGKAIHWVDRKTFDLDHTANWYPHCGDVDRATYEATLRWPKKLDLLASGRLIEGGSEGRFRWQRRRLDKPSIAFSFALGRFEVVREQVGHVEVSIGFNHSAPRRLSATVRDQVMESVREALLYFEETFGPYPLDHLTVVLLPRRYSQSYLGFMTLTDSILPPNLPPEGTSLDWYRSTTIAHELAHQWWGNLIGWASYRDQWLSEAMANYAAQQFWSDTREGGAAFLSQMAAGWRTSLTRMTPIGRPVESLGPIILGVRLNSSLADNGYRAIVYRKGAVVLAMMARAIGTEPFKKMSRSLIEAASDRVVSTATFLRAFEHMSGLDLSGFAQRYIYGTGIPSVFYSYEWVEDPTTGWELRGQAQLAEREKYEQRVVRRSDGGWDIRSTLSQVVQDPSSALVVPYRMLLDDGGAAMASNAPHRRPVQRGDLTIAGATDQFVIPATEEPQAFRLDPRGEVLARFFSEQTHPKRFKEFQAQALLLEGDVAAAQMAFEAALEVEIESVDPTDLPVPWLRPTEMRRAHADARIHLQLARIYLDRGNERAAERALSNSAELSDDAPDLFGIERETLEGRLELRRGEFNAAYRRAKRALRLTNPRRQQGYWRLRGWQAQVGADWWATTEMLAILAVSAFETEQSDVLAWALKGARERGVDLRLLERQIDRLQPQEAAAP